MTKAQTRIERIMQLAQDLVDDELHNALSSTDGGAPGHEKQTELDLAVANSRAKLRAEIEKWIK